MSSRGLLRALRSILGLALALALVGWVVARSGIDPWDVLSRVDRRFFALAFLIYGVGFLSASWRWYLLLAHIRVRLPFFTVLRLALIGLFSNLFVPGGVGGDLIKVVYLKRESGDRYPQALLTVLLDRLLGLAGLLSLAMVAIALNASMVKTGSPEMRGVLGVVAVACAAGLAFGLVFWAWPLLSRWSAAWHGRVSSGLPAGLLMVLGKVADALHLLRAAPAKLFALLLLSTVGHLTAAIGVFLLVVGLGARTYLSFAECLLATQLANLVAAVPLTPGGLGGRDLVMDLLFRGAGAPPSVSGAIPVMVTVLLISWSLVGGLALLWERKVTRVGEEQAKASVGLE